MEPLTTATATALATVLTTKAVEKIGGNMGDAVWVKAKDKANKFLALLRSHSPNAAQEIEQADEQSFDYSKAVPEVVTLAQNNPELSQLIHDLAELSKNNSLPNIFNQNIEKAVNAAQTIHNIDQRGSTFNF